MPKFKVTIIERSIVYKSKVFEALDENAAREQAEQDESWSDWSGWEKEGEITGECGIDEVEAL